MRIQPKTTREEEPVSWPAGRRALSRLLLGAALSASSPAAAGAQAAPHMFALVTPPATVGTCKPPEPDRSDIATGGRKVRTSSMIMTTRDPGGERDIIATLSDAGALVGYAELVMRQTSLGVSDNDMVMARATREGTILGTMRHIHLVMQVPDLDTLKLPLAQAMNDMQSHAKRTSSLKPLDANEKARVRAMANWLIHRCPPQ